MARLGGDEFAVLAVECNPEAGKLMVERVQMAMQQTGISASMGLSCCQLHLSLFDVYQEAHEQMYEAKRVSQKLLDPIAL